MTDNFYTRHQLANAILQFTDGDVRILGTVRMNYVDSVNNGNVKKAVQLLKDQPRGTWYLIAAYNRDPNYNKEKKRQQAETWKRKKDGNDANASAFIPARGEKGKKAGYIVWLDSKSVIFYTNDLFCDVPEDIIPGTSDEAVKCVHGLVDIQCWLGSESFCRTTIRAPAIVVAYNYSRNGVDRMDQQRAVNPTKRKG